MQHGVPSRLRLLKDNRGPLSGMLNDMPSPAGGRAVHRDLGMIDMTLERQRGRTARLLRRRFPSGSLASGLLAAVLAFMAGACLDGPTVGDRDPPGMVVEPIQIDSVVVTVGTGEPVEVTARITGVIGDGCAQLLPVRQSRQGSAIAIDIERRRPRGAICILIGKLYDQTHRLPGEFPSGDYELRVNGRAYPFRVP